MKACFPTMYCDFHMRRGGNPKHFDVPLKFKEILYSILRGISKKDSLNFFWHSTDGIKKKKKGFINHQPAAHLSRNCTRHQGRPDQAFPRDCHVDTLCTLSFHRCFPISWGNAFPFSSWGFVVFHDCHRNERLGKDLLHSRPDHRSVEIIPDPFN